MSLKQPSTRPSAIPVSIERIQANELKIGDAILGMSGAFSAVRSVRETGTDKLEVNTDAGENMVLKRGQMVAIQR
jgi:preprotein translocase subunit YajC